MLTRHKDIDLINHFKLLEFIFQLQKSICYPIYIPHQNIFGVEFNKACFFQYFLQTLLKREKACAQYN